MIFKSFIVFCIYFGNLRCDMIFCIFFMSFLFFCGEFSIIEYNLVIYELIVFNVGILLVLGSIKFVNVCIRVVWRLFRWLSNIMLVFCCWFVFIFIFFIVCFKFFMCLEVSEFCFLNLVVVLWSCFSLFLCIERIRLRRVYKVFEWWRLYLLYYEEWGLILVFG